MHTTSLTTLLTTYGDNQAQLRRLQAEQAEKLRQLAGVYRPIIEAHLDHIHPLFNRHGLERHYIDRFGAGYCGLGSRWDNVVLADDGITVHSHDTYGCGDSDYYEFKLPASYLTNDPKAQLQADIAYFQRAFDRLDRARQYRDARQAEQAAIARDAAERAELQRLLAKFESEEK
jgi:hypothetical protein